MNNAPYTASGPRKLTHFSLTKEKKKIQNFSILYFYLGAEIKEQT